MVVKADFLPSRQLFSMFSMTEIPRSILMDLLVSVESRMVVVAHSVSPSSVRDSA